MPEGLTRTKLLFAPSSQPKTMSALRFVARAATFSRATLMHARAQPKLVFPPRAAFSAAAGLSKDDVQTRVLEVLKGFEKVNPTKVRYSKQPCLPSADWGREIARDVLRLCRRPWIRQS